MGKLKAARPTLAPVRPRIGYVAGDAKAQSKARESFAPWRAWYRTHRWAKLRKAVLLRDLYTCRMCGRAANSPDLVADHIVPHRGDAALFWCGEAGLQTLCASCHGGAKQRAEAAR